jgi:uncharacterized hydrophobic protein (TIGR00271 family)
MRAQAGVKIMRETRFQRWLGVGTHKRLGIYTQVYQTADLASVNYWLELLFSAGIAALGLVTNSPAVIIGAMLISPLMDPIMATGLALAAGDVYLAIKAIAKLLASVVLAVGLSALMVWLLPFHSITSEVLARISPTLLDLGIALFSGLAGSVAVCRSSSGSGVTTLPGVAVAVALMPPLCTIGFGLGDGANTRIMGGAGLLFLTNLVAIVSCAFAIFLLVGMNAPEVRAQMEHSRKGERLAEKFSRGSLSHILANGGKLHWRILMLAILLAAIAVPLRTAFVQVAGEAIVRGAVQDVVKTLLPADALLSQQVDVGRKSVTVRLISTQNVPTGRLQDAEREIERRTGRRTAITVSSIASQSELADLMQRLTAPALPLKPPEPTVAEIEQKLIQRVQPVIGAAWPPEAPLQSFDLQLSPSGLVVNAEYASYREMGKIAQDMIARQLQQKLGIPDLSLKARRSPGSYRILENARKKAK